MICSLMLFQRLESVPTWLNVAGRTASSLGSRRFLGVLQGVGIPYMGDLMFGRPPLAHNSHRTGTFFLEAVGNEQEE